MATFTSGFTPNTSVDGNDLIITDTSVYNDTLPKTVFTSRSILITKSDATTETVDFPYDGSANTVEDEITIADFFDKDYYLTIAVTWEFSNEGTPDTETNTLDYLSNYNALIGFVRAADESEYNEESTSSTLLTKLNNYIEAAILWGKFGNPQKAQKFLDACKDINDSLEDIE